MPTCQDLAGFWDMVHIQVTNQVLGIPYAKHGSGAGLKLHFKKMTTKPVLRIRDVYSGSRILIFTHPRSRIPDPKTAAKEMGEKLLSYLFFFHIIENYFILEMLKKKIWANFQRIIDLFTQKIVTKLSKIWVSDPKSEIWKKPIPDPGSRGQKSTGSRIRIRNTVQNIFNDFLV